MWAGKLLADAGADTILVEPKGGSKPRWYEPFYLDKPDPERSLYFWHYNTSKRGVCVDLTAQRGRELVKKLVAAADVFITCEDADTLTELGLGYADIADLNPRLVYVSITSHGKDRHVPATDLTILAEGGPVWSCGYDDHTLPPVRGGGNQGYQTACHFAVMSTLAALLYREASGEGQFIDVNAVAASNVSTEVATYEWLVAQKTVRRQTGRHASVEPTQPTTVLCADGVYAYTGVPPRRAEQFAAMHDWLTGHGLVEQFSLSEVLLMGARGGAGFEDSGMLDLSRRDDPQVGLLMEASRDALAFLAGHLPGYEFYVEGQERGFQVGIVYSPDEAMGDEHLASRGFATEVHHPEFGRTFTYPGHPYRFLETPWRISRRAPLLGEHNFEVFTEVGVARKLLEELSRSAILSGAGELEIRV